MRELSTSDLEAIESAPRCLFLLEVRADGLPEPMRVSQVDIISCGARYLPVPIELETRPELDAITVRGEVGILGRFLEALRGAKVTVRVILETAPDDPLTEREAIYWPPHDHDSRDVIGYLRLVPEPRKLMRDA